MASKIVFRTLLVAALLVTAHTIKPFSLNNVALQALGTARSLSFALPGTAAENIEHAYYLAQTYGKGLFDDDAASLWAKPNLFQSELVAVANSVELDGDAEIKDVKSADSSRKPAQKRSVKRIRRDDTRDEESNCSKNSEISHLPQVHTIKAIALTPPPSVLAYQSRLIAAFYSHTNKFPGVTRLKADWVQLKPALLTSSCREAEQVQIEVTEAPVEVTTGPEEELFFAEPTPAPQVAMPECIRIP
ncbi:MAG: hypothetical protein JST85_03205 [Acidobacteria bacterium]|nr:hypothetical protein [Acidobacteriota bacterium]